MWAYHFNTGVGLCFIKHLASNKNLQETESNISYGNNKVLKNQVGIKVICWHWLTQDVEKPELQICL